MIPGLLKYGDVPEIASLIAPRPCLWEVGSHDGLMVKEWIPPALARIQRAYRAFDAAHNLDVDYFDGKHRWNGLKAYPLASASVTPLTLVAPTAPATGAPQQPFPIAPVS